MRAVFVDTAYWIALILRGDPWADAVDRATALIGNARLVTTEEVLAEFLAGVSRAGKQARRQAAEMVRHILADPDALVVRQSHDSFVGISGVLTSDHHFRQEGFEALMSVPGRNR